MNNRPIPVAAARLAMGAAVTFVVVYCLVVLVLLRWSITAEAASPTSNTAVDPTVNTR